MNRAWTPRLLMLVALLALVAAIGLTVTTIRQADVCRQSLAHRAKELEGLTVVRAELAVYETAFGAFDACEVAPPPLTALIGGLLPSGHAPEMRDVSEAGPAGWEQRRQELSFEQVAVSDAITFAHASETPIRDAQGHERPGWRLAQCTVRPIPGRPGVGRVVLVMETLVRGGGGQ